MTATLVLHLHGPLQAWGAGSRFDSRNTEDVPTKSAIVGVLAAALARPRHSDVCDLAALHMATRVDRPGLRLRDYHTVGAGYPTRQRLLTAEGKIAKRAIVTERFYLADAAFTVALTGDDDVVRELSRALARPRWAPYLGRRACPPAEPFVLGVTTDEPVALLEHRLPVVRRVRAGGTTVRFHVDDPSGSHRPLRDRPGERSGVWASYTTRPVREWATALPAERFTDDPFTLPAYLATVP
ncbi:MAG: type I-E CRISPR-associated protein Cas5/CasD [Microthrixaceae bacterium]|nr:type I-E CRISPR-associated protein Cas5/CasD [Microthrixaceae bacterium]